MAKIVILGDKAYVKRLSKHLKKEHPSTKDKMFLVGVAKKKAKK